MRTAREHFDLGKRRLLDDQAGELMAEELLQVQNCLAEIRADGSLGPLELLDLKSSLPNFFTATPRAGSAPSKYLDLLGTPSGKNGVMGYVRVRVEE